MTKNNKFDDLMLAIKEDEEKTEEQTKSDVTLELEKQVFADQFRQQEVLWQKQGARLVNIMRNNEGVWISKRLFYIVGILSLLSIGIIAIEIYVYVYFYWMA